MAEGLAALTEVNPRLGLAVRPDHIRALVDGLPRSAVGGTSAAPG